MTRRMLVTVLLLVGFLSGPAVARECDNFRGAGILPYAFDDSGRALVLLGYGPGRGWGGFGGGPKRVITLQPPAERCETRFETAARETVEESRQLLSRAQLAAALENAPRYPLDPKAGQFQTFIVRVDFIDVAAFYRNATLSGREYGYQEMSEIAWVALDALVDHVADGKPLPTPNEAGLWPVFATGFIEALGDQGRADLFP